MATTSRRLKRPNDDLSSLTEAINALDFVKDKASLNPARDAFYSASGLLATIRVRLFFVHHQEKPESIIISQESVIDPE